VVGRGVFVVYPENPAAALATGPVNMRASLDTALRTKQLDQMPRVRYDIIGASGEFEPRYWSSHTQPVLDAAGQVQYLLHSTQDITASVQAENSQQALHKIEQTYGLFLQAPVAVCIVMGPESVVALANDEMRRLLGAAGDLVGTPLAALLPKAPGVAKVLDQVRKTGQPYAGTEYPVSIRLAGREEQRYYNFVFQPYFENAWDSTATGVFSVAHEVTAQVLARQRIEESEYRYRRLIEEAPVAMALYLGPEIRIQYANDLMLGYWGRGMLYLGKHFARRCPSLLTSRFLLC
jgi:PAS domain-containing protein